MYNRDLVQHTCLKHDSGAYLAPLSVFCIKRAHEEGFLLKPEFKKETM